MAGKHDQPLVLLEDEMKNDETETRIAAMRRLATVAAALGPAKTVSELIPFLIEQVEDDDEVLLVMAEQLGKFVPLVGGGDHAVCLIELLGALATVEEMVVREKAVQSANAVMEALSATAVTERVIPVIERLTKGDWFTARVSACSLFSAAYVGLRDGHEAEKKKLRELFVFLCRDETPMVRRAAARNIGPLSRVIDKAAVLKDVMPAFQQLSVDDQDSVRLLAITSVAHLAEVLDEAESQQHLLQLARDCAGDKSWRVRNHVAKEFHALSSAVGAEVAVRDLLPWYVRLLQDAEAEVRASAVAHIDAYCALIGVPLFVERVVPVLQDLCHDVAQSVRVCLAGGITQTITKLPQEQAAQHLLRLTLQLMISDEAAEVRLKALTGLPAVAQAVGPVQVKEKVVPVLQTLFADQANWRIREQVLMQMPLMAKAMGEAGFNDALAALYLSGFEDGISAVRLAAGRVVGPLTRELGPGWAADRVVPVLNTLFDPEKPYLGRVTVLRTLEAIASFGGSAASIVPSLLRFGQRGATDKVPNVRHVAACALGAMLGVADSAMVERDVRPLLQRLAGDDDPDTKNAAGDALEGRR